MAAEEKLMITFAIDTKTTSAYQRVTQSRTKHRALTSEKKRGDLTTRWPPRACSSSGMASRGKANPKDFLFWLD